MSPTTGQTKAIKGQEHSCEVERNHLFEWLFHRAAYFYRMHAEANYSIIDGLKIKAETNLCQAFEGLFRQSRRYAQTSNSRISP